ncbi:MAG TPA: UbiA family prenyltransferase [bacterium]|nr:UbiA family prenyltransferase [bacterium]HMW36174.1 UbiA family prenyltransferase [bacterium]HMY35144.1 UbiA family prenyltransferase [bacterium]HMZ04087.1 UbiA family prenyltransferase [bacterium]HNB09337.1 UbiA family prenyltransferase [bacterium]
MPVSSSKTLRRLDYFFILRPILFIPGWTTTLAGYMAATGQAKHWPVWNGLWYPDMMGLFISTAMLMGSGFLVNQLRDIETDRINKKLFFLYDGSVNPRILILQSILLSAGCLVMASFWGERMLIVHFFGWLLIAILYNLPPFRLKDRAVTGLLANAGMGVFALAYGWALSDQSWLLFLITGFPYFIFNGALCVLTMIPDTEGDAATSKKTFTVRYGVTFSMYTAFVLFCIAAITAFILDQYVLLVVLVSVIPMFVFMVIRKTKADAIRALKFSIFFFTSLVAMYFPFYIILLIFLFVCTRWYFKTRFDFDYPNLQGR